jgi:serine/threonine-protein kinase
MNDTVVQPTYAFEGFRLDAQHRVLSRADGQSIPLAPKVFDTLLYFVERPGQLIAKRELLEAIWPHVVVEENNLTQAISALRRILGESPGAHRFIATEPGRGYRLVASVRTLSRSLDELSAAPEAAAPMGDGETPATRAPLTPRGRSGWRGIGITAPMLAVVSSAIVGTVVWFAAEQGADPVSRQVMRFTIPSPAFDANIWSPSGRALAVSPDGARLVFSSAGVLFVRSRERVEVTPLPGLQRSGAGAPFFSPDGQWIGFTDGQTLKKVPIAGGAAVTITEVGPAAFGSWTAEGIVFADMKGLFRVSAEGGTPEPLLTDFDASEQVLFPQLLPERRAILFTVIPTRSQTPGALVSQPDARVEALDLATGERRTLVRGGGRAQYVATGHLVYAAGATLYAVAFDIDRLEVQGEPVAVTAEPSREFALSEEGTLIYQSGVGVPGARQHVLAWVDREGREELLEKAPARAYAYPRLSPDGMRLALNTGGPPAPAIWMWDVRRQALDRFTLDPAGNSMLAWSPDGQRLVFGSSRLGLSNLFWQAADGTGEPERLLESDHRQMPLTFAPDGRLLFSAEVAGHGRDIHALSMDGSHRVEHILYGPNTEGEADVSPDGRWIAYESDESGQVEIYVRPYPDAYSGSRWPISSGGGKMPLWSRDGRELFYRDFGGAMLAASVAHTPTFAPGPVVKLFENANYFGSGSSMSGRTYDLSLDGSRFLMIKQQANGEAAALVVVLNWFEELKRLVPTE